MANKQLVDFITAENELDGQELVYIAQSGKTRKTVLQKIKDFIIGTNVMGTTATDVTGAVAELKGKIDSNTSSLKDMANEVATNKSDINNLKTSKQNKIEDSGWIDLVLLNNVTTTVSAQYRKIGNTVCFRGNITNIPIDSTIFANLPVGFRFVGGGVQRIFNLPLNGTNIAKISIDMNGNCRLLTVSNGSNANNVYILDNVNYIID